MTLYQEHATRVPKILLREVDDWGIRSLDLVRPPQRFWGDDGSRIEPVVRPAVDVARTTQLADPASLLRGVGPGDNVSAMSRRSLARLQAWFLLAEDPQRRLESREVATLCHQASLVRHVLSHPELRRVLIADEVGLGKTIEAGLILKALLEEEPGLRVLYLAPARLVGNVRREFERLGLPFRSWVSGTDRDATLSDPLVVASIHRAAHPNHTEAFAESHWDVLVVDECHHLSDWAKGGGKAVRKYRLVDELQQRLPRDGRLLLLSGTPHQGHRDRFANLISLLRSDDEPDEAVAGRVIYRTKEDVHDWDGRPLFPKRQVNEATVLELSEPHREWLEQIHELFEASDTSGDARGRAAGWRCGQALQWATSSIHAGLGYLVRQAIRADWTLEDAPVLRAALVHLRPYRGGRSDEPPTELFERISKEIRHQREVADVADLEEDVEDRWRPDPALLRRALQQAIELIQTEADAKWRLIDEQLLSEAADEKVVLFAQPVETVTALCRYLERKTGKRPAMIIGNQSDAERQHEIELFWREDGPQYLVSSRAGGEGINLQVARRLVHVDVPWNPMELEQRVGRVHRFMSRRTILVDTVVVRGSREEDMYAVARRKLGEIAATLVPAERLDMLFSRVMALVPPEELSAMLGQQALGPLSDAERDLVSSMVSAGFERWKEFHGAYSRAQRDIQELEAGQATWEDLARFAESYADAKPATGFSALSFTWDDDEVRESSVAAHVLEIDGRPHSCGDHGGMPVTRPDGTRATGLGLNVPAVAKAMREHGLTLEPTGAAHLRWRDEFVLPNAIPPGEPVLILVIARVSVHSPEGGWRESGVSLCTHVFRSDGARHDFAGVDASNLVREVREARIRAKPWQHEPLLSKAEEWQHEMLMLARRPNDAELSGSVRHAAFPLFTAVVGP